ncbi:plasmid pRiA4b ORF-3 family protein [Rhodopila sp.]|uniref:plasmid pRiA4b ORF-3 family protein n=1 Tax=Rhodopila sp. TaxID=2480087 RepID=UPI003D0E9D3C
MDTPEKYARIRLSLQDITPEIWRRVEVPLGMNLKGLHDVIQAVIGWSDYHLFEFRIGEKSYGVPAPDEDYGRKVHHAKSMKLQALVNKGIERFDYAYDFGDDWHLTVVIEAVGETDPTLFYPRFVDGARRGPPEDVGGPFGYPDFLKAVTNRRNREHRRLIEWYGGPYDPDDLDLSNMRERLAWIVQRRQAGKAAYASASARRT